MKIGVLGAGKWGQNHVRTLNALGALGGIADPSDAVREKMSVTYPGVPVVCDPAQLIDDPNLAGLVIATHAETHAPLAKQAMAAGKDVLVEKPVTLNTADAEELARLAKEQGRVMMVGHLLLYQPAVAYLKQAIQDGVVGKLTSIHQERLNLGRARDVENVLWSLGVHDVAVALSLVGEPVQAVTASGQCVLNQKVEDDVYTHIEFEGGAQVHLHNSWLWPELRRRTIVVGAKAMLVYDEIAQTVTLHKKSINEKLENVNQGEELVFEGAGEPLKLELEHFMCCIESREEPRTGGASAVEVIKVLEMAGAN